MTAEPTKEFLRAVREEGNSQNDPRNREHPISIGR
jgi:hypothetical protein